VITEDRFRSFHRAFSLFCTLQLRSVHTLD
jgi:hypothetical protein